MKKKKKIFIYGANYESNLGGPLIIHGLARLFGESFPDVELVYCIEKKIGDVPADLKRYIDAGDGQMLVIYGGNIQRKAWVELALGLKSKRKIANGDDVREEVLTHFLESDVVVDAWGINYCDSLLTPKSLLRGIIWEKPILLAAKIRRKRTVHYTASYGPMTQPKLRQMCKLITSYLCDKLICREVASKKALEEVGVKSSKLYVSPDSGLVVRACAPTRDSGHAGKSKMFLSVSHRMAKEWKGETSYVQAISQVCEYVKADLGADILLIPNELGAKADYDDTVTCEAVYSELADISGVQIFDSRSKSPLELKAEIAGCDLGVVSRYHSCVAALSSGVPIVVVGWHYKYGELLQHFNQKDCFVKQEGCSFELIRDKVQQVWSEREQRRDQILECYDIAHKTVFDTCRSVLGPYLD